MQEAQRVPLGLAAIPPGPELAAALAGVDLDQAVAGDAVELLRAAARQLAHDQARVFAAMVRVGRAVAAEARSPQPASWRGPVIGEWAGAQIGAALTWTTAKADREHDVAVELVCRLPLVFAELQAGRIDQGRAWTFVDVLGCAELTAAQIQRICAALGPLASGLTSGQIRARLLRLLIGVDPGYAARRYRRAVRERGVHGYLGKDGTATITGTGLSTDEAIAACERIEHLAKAVKTAGHPATLTQIQADLFTRLLDGRLDRMGREEMVAAMLTDTDTDTDTEAETSTDLTVAHTAADARPDATAEPATADVPAADVPADVAATEVAAAEVPAAAVPAADWPAAEVPAAGLPVAEVPVAEVVAAAEVVPAVEVVAAAEEMPAAEMPAAEVPAAAVPAADWPAAEAPAADWPAAEVPAAGLPVAEVPVAEVVAAAEVVPAVEVVAAAEVVVRAAEFAEAVGVTEAVESAGVCALIGRGGSGGAGGSVGDPGSAAGWVEPGVSENGVASGVGGSRSSRRGGEVRVGLVTLMGRDGRPGEVPGWGPVLAEVARGMVGRQHRAQWRFAVLDAQGYLVLAGITRRRPRGAGDRARECVGGVVEICVPAVVLVELAAACGSCGVWAGVVADIAGRYARRHRLQRVLDARPGDRFAGAVLRRHGQVRDRTCVAPGCRRPAWRCDQDHTVDHGCGGLTVTGNTGALCRRHHRMKHEGRWRLEQPRPGRFCWTSPLGRVYRTRGEPIDPPLPEPAPRSPEESADLDEPDPRTRFAGPQPILRRPPPAAPAPPTTAPVTSTVPRGRRAPLLNRQLGMPQNATSALRNGCGSSEVRADAARCRVESGC